MADIQAIGVFVSTAVWTIWPAFLLSVALGVVVRALKLNTAIERLFQGRIVIAIILATVIGAGSPFCSCTVIPIVSSMLLSSVPLAPVMAFWIASPTMDPEIFALSVATLGWDLALIRLSATMFLSLAAGFITAFIQGRGWIGTSILKQTQASSCSTTCNTSVEVVTAGISMQFTLTGTPQLSGGFALGTIALIEREPTWWESLRQRVRNLNWKRLLLEIGQQSWSLGRWILLAFVLEALIVLYIPQTAIVEVFGFTNPLAIPLAALIGIPLYLNNMSALPIVAGLLEQGMNPGAAIAFLIAGPVTTIPAMTAVWGIVHKRIFGLYLVYGIGGAILLGFLTMLFS